MNRITIFFAAFCFLLAGTMKSAAVLATNDAGRTAIALEVLSRMKGMDLEAKPSLKSAVMKVLESTRGTTNFVKIVQDFKLKDQNPGLFEVAVKNPAEETGVEAMRMILASRDLKLVTEGLTGTNVTTAVQTAEVLGNTADKEIVPLLLPVVMDVQRDVAVRKQAVRSLVRVQEGAAELLKMAKEDKLPNDVKLTASMELNGVRWANLKAEAAKVLPLPQGRNTEPLPPVIELLKVKGDVARGSQVFARQEVGCINCHRINDKGNEVGPALSEIGTKLGRDAIYEAILDPSAGISFGFEAWQIELKSGDEPFGLIVSETADELTMKDTKAIVTRIKKSDIVKRQQMKTSIMPTGLQQTMSTQDLIDLVEYLGSLKKAAQ
ncbi:MAG: Heme-binding protein [Pedosphaera sp.]|nr:Heme-binding protein [Pedosphaera sp.]